MKKLIDHITRFFKENDNLYCTQDDVYLALRADGISCSSASVSRRMREHADDFDTINVSNYKKWRIKPAQPNLL